MRVTINSVLGNSVEVTGCVFNTPESVDRFIAALLAAKKQVWGDQPKPTDEKK